MPYDPNKPVWVVISVASGVASVDDELSNIPNDVVVEIQDHDEVYCPVCNSNTPDEYNAETGKYEPRPCKSCKYCTESE